MIKENTGPQDSRPSRDHCYILRRMRKYRMTAAFLALLALSAFGREKDPTGLVKKAVERITLDQPGTKPFHLKAVLAPTRVSDNASNPKGEVEIWWESPTEWRREVRSPDFHQIAIVNGAQEWQKNDGDYFPEWLRELAIAFVNPVPRLDEVLKQVDEADVKNLAGSTYYSWIEMSTNGSTQKGMGAAFAINESTGLPFYGGGLGWGASFDEYKAFHGRMVARKISWGTPEVTARVTALEDLRDVPPDFIDAAAKGGDAAALRTVIVEETALRKNLLTPEPVQWPPLQDGPLEGSLTTRVVVDRTGRVREVGTIVSDNQGVNDPARNAIAAMQFKPYVENGVPVQVLSRITMAFKTVRPAGAENFESARTYFDRGWHVGFPAAINGPPYTLRATVQAAVKAGKVENGEYVDTWKSAIEWRREARIGNSEHVRTQNGEKRYELAKGPDVALLRFVFRVIVPIPAADTFVESDWKIRRDQVDGANTIRVLAGYESPAGVLDTTQARAYWFDDTGRLVKTYFTATETQRSDFEDFNGAQVAQLIKVFQKNTLVMVIRVTQVSAAKDVPDKILELHGHGWQRAFTSEMR